MLERLKTNLRPYLPRNIRGTLRAWKERGSAHSHIFCEKPAVITLIWGTDRVVIHDVMANRPLTLLYLFAWAVTPSQIIEICQLVRETLRRHPQHRVVMLCNEAYTVDLFQAGGVEAIFCSHNCYVNENYFKIDETAVKKYDAIYNAAMAPYKRHPLAAKIESLALITYHYPGTHENDYDQEVRTALAHAAWLVDALKDDQKATAAQVAGYYGQSRVGLCLSKVEGAMFASIEYLLCGIPVVTSRNSGGRDAFFDPDYVEWVDDDPESVRDGVARLIARAPSAESIRARTLVKMEEHRQRLRELVKGEVPQLQIPWAPGTHGPLTFRNLREVGQRLKRL